MKAKEIKLSALSTLSSGEKVHAIDALVSAARAPRNGQAVDIESRIKAYEHQYGVSSDEMRSRFRAGTFRDSAEVSSWLMLLRAKSSSLSR